MTTGRLGGWRGGKQVTEVTPRQGGQAVAATLTGRGRQGQAYLGDKPHGVQSPGKEKEALRSSRRYQKDEVLLTKASNPWCPAQSQLGSQGSHKAEGASATGSAHLNTGTVWKRRGRHTHTRRGDGARCQRRKRSTFLKVASTYIYYL